MENPFHTIEPCESLKKYVSCYYFIKSEDKKFSSKHYSFPHTYNSLSIYKDCELDYKPFSINVSESLTSNYHLFVQVKKQAPLLVNLSGKINRATILFKDFGINHFISEPLSKIMGCPTNQFSSWIEDSLFSSFVENLFNADNEQEQAKVIDEFLLHKLLPVPLSYLEEAVTLLCNFEENIPIEKIASQFKVSLRSFNRNFIAVMGVSPVEYRRIARFRHSIENKLFQSQFKRLTEIGFESHFYDQSYFNKIYLKLTGSNPGKFFKCIERIGNDKLVFQFIKK